MICIFDIIKKKEIANDLKPIVKKEEDSLIYLFENSQYVFINNVTIAFNKVHFDEDHLRFYIDDESIAAIAIPNIEKIDN